MVLLEEQGVLRIDYEEDSNIHVHEWFDYNPENKDKLVLELLDRIYELLKEYPTKKVMVKATNARGAFSPAVQQFIHEVQFPRLVADTQVRYVATIKPRTMLEKLGTELWEAHLKMHPPIEMWEVDSEEAAREWLDIKVPVQAQLNDM